MTATPHNGTYSLLCGVCAYRLVEWDDQPSLDDLPLDGVHPCGACGETTEVFRVRWSPDA